MTKPAGPPEGTRLVVANENLLDQIGTRNDAGDRLTFEWGEPDANGWYTPWVTAHPDDNLAQSAVAEERARLRAAVEGLAPNGWFPASPDGWIQVGDGGRRMQRAVLALLDEQP